MLFKKNLKYIFIFVLILFLIFEATYLLGTQKLPSDKKPILNVYSEDILNVLWITFSGKGSREMESLYLYNLFSKKNGWVSSSSARVILNRENKNWSSNLEWHFMFMVAQIWVSRNWSSDEAISTVLSSAYFGYDFYGIKNAAKGYYQRELDDLTIYELTILGTLLKQPQYYDPWKNRDCLFDRARKYVEQNNLLNGKIELDLEKAFFSRMASKPSVTKNKIAL